MEELLKQGTDALKAGKRDEARKLFLEALEQDPNNESLWSWLYTAANDNTERIRCLKEMLRINPANEKASQFLLQLSQTSTNNTNPHQQVLYKKCPYCAETIKREAIVCRFCGRDLRTGKTPTSISAKQKEWNPGTAALLSFLIPGAGSIYKGRIGVGIFLFVMAVIGYFFFIVPGIIIHLIAIWDAYSGNPYKMGS